MIEIECSKAEVRNVDQLETVETLDKFRQHGTYMVHACILKGIVARGRHMQRKILIECFLPSCLISSEILLVHC
jgi:hypothetical protein